VVGEETYTRLKDMGHFREEQQYGRSVLVNESFEINTSWGVLEKDQTLQDLAKQSVIVDEVRYITLDFLLAVKKSWLQSGSARQKDSGDVKLIEEYMAK
jgi:hypothetical protein